MATDKGEATRERILEASLELFELGGFQNMRINKICARVGLSPTSVYWHFGSKAGLVQAVLESAFAPLGISMLEDIRGASGPRQITVFISHLRKLIHERPMGACTMLAYLQDESHRSDDLDIALRKTRGDELAGQIKLMKTMLKLNSSQAKKLSITINACVNYAVMIKLSGGSDLEIEDVLATIRQQITSADELGKS